MMTYPATVSIYGRSVKSFLSNLSESSLGEGLRPGKRGFIVKFAINSKPANMKPR